MGWDKDKKREWCRNNREKCREYTKRYREKYPEKIRKQQIAYYEKNKENVLEKCRRYRMKHPVYYDKHTKCVNKTINNRVISFEDYDDNIMIATIDIQVEYRTKLERGVIE